LGDLYSLLITRPSSVVLDIGTGFMRNLELLLRTVPSSVKIYSIDPSPGVVEEASRRFQDEIERGRVVVRRASAEELPFKEKSFNYITSAITFHHIRDKEAALNEVDRVMAHDGLGIILDWDREGANYSPHSPEHLEESLAELKKLIHNKFKVKLEHQEGRIYYCVVFEKKEK